jgi:uncharacterized protein YutE (UPF0331/DUF86 family)
MSICQLFVAGMRLGLPSEENDIFEKLVRAQIVSPELAMTLHRMKGFRNIFAHEYGDVDDDLVFLFLRTWTGDFLLFRKAVLEALGRS